MECEDCFRKNRQKEEKESHTSEEAHVSLGSGCGSCAAGTTEYGCPKLQSGKIVPAGVGVSL